MIMNKKVRSDYQFFQLLLTFDLKTAKLKMNRKQFFDIILIWLVIGVYASI